MRSQVFLIGLMATGFALPAQAQVTISSQYSSVSGASNVITAARVPVQNGTDPVQYFDVTITMAATQSGGEVTGVTATATSAPSQSLKVANFVAGTYLNAQTGATYTVSGPGVDPGGSTSWSITETSGTDCLGQGTWYTATGKSNPEYQRVKAAGITATGYSFGVQGVPPGNCTGAGAIFFDGALWGAQQDGNSLVISTFSYDGGDYSTPRGMETLTKQ